MHFEKAGTEHLLLAMLKETDCVGTRLLYTMGANIQKLYAAVLTAMGMDSDAIAEEFQAVKAAGTEMAVQPLPLISIAETLLRWQKKAGWIQ